MRRLSFSSVWQFPHLIRFRLTLWYTGLAAVVLAAFVGTVFYAFNNYQFNTLDNQAKRILTATLNQAVKVNTVAVPCPTGRSRPYARVCSMEQPVVTVHQADTPGANDTAITAYAKNGSPLKVNGDKGKAPNSPLNSSAARAETQKVAKAASKDRASHPAESVLVRPQYHLITMSLSTKEGARIVGQIVVRFTRVEDQVTALKQILVYAAGVLLIISAVGGWFLAGRALKPIDELTRRAQQISAYDLSQRLGLAQEDELGRLAATFDDMIGRLQDAFERHKRFTSDASHELRTPLTVMQADIGLALSRPRSASEYQETLVSMDEEVSRLSVIVNDLLMLTRIDVDPAGMQHEAVALDEMLRKLASRVGLVAAERAITVQAEHLDPVTVTGDTTRLRQLFTNLLDNAVTYTPDGGRVTVALDKTREGARVRVSDTGIGIAPDEQAHVFERFYRTDEARTRNGHGTGLGLAIARSVVLAHHGDISVQSTPGAGTTFTVVLPADGRKRARRFHTLRGLAPGGAAAR